MGLRGPQPDSDEMRKRKGYPGKRGKNPPKKKVNLNALTKLPNVPSHFGPEAGAEWKRVGKVLIESGKLTNENLRLFEAYCYSYGIFREAQNKLTPETMIVLVGRAEDEKPNPLIQIAKDAQNMMLKTLRAIQTSASAPTEKAMDPLENFFKRAEKLKVVKGDKE